MTQPIKPPRKIKPTTSFADAIAVVPIPETPNHFSAKIPWDWTGGSHAHGGYTTSLLLSCARTYFAGVRTTNPLPDPISIHVQFLSPLPTGAARLCVRELGSGRQYATVQIELQSPRKDGSFKTCHMAIVTQGNLATEKGLSIETVPAVAKGEIPDRERDCERWVQPEWILRAFPVGRKMLTWRAKGGVDDKWVEGPGYLGLGTRDSWMRWTDESMRFDVLSLGLLCDFFLSAPTNFFPHQEDLKTITYPTMCLGVEVKKDPKDAKWLFIRVGSHQIRNGRFDQEVTVLDEKGELVALSNHVCTAIEMVKRNPERVTQRVDKL